MCLWLAKVLVEGRRRVKLMFIESDTNKRKKNNFIQSRRINQIKRIFRFLWLKMVKRIERNLGTRLTVMRVTQKSNRSRNEREKLREWVNWIGRSIVSYQQIERRNDSRLHECQNVRLIERQTTDQWSEFTLWFCACSQRAQSTTINCLNRYFSYFFILVFHFAILCQWRLWNWRLR